MSLDQLKKVFIEAFGISTSTDFEKLTYRSIPEWDSVAHMQLISALENQFGVMIETEDVIAMSSFSKAREILSKYGVQL